MRKAAPHRDRPRYWTSPDHRDLTADYRKELLHRYKDHQPMVINDISRRRFLALMGASMALAGLAGCRRQVKKIVPYVVQPEEITPGVPEYYASNMPRGNSVYGVVIESHEGRPIKVEGNPDHPESLGGADIWMLASVLDLYDPDRSQAVQRNGATATYADFVSFWRSQATSFAQGAGDGLAVLAEPFASPTVARFRKEFHRRYPKAKWVTWGPISDENSQAAARLVFGDSLSPIYHYDKADVVLSLDADFLYCEPRHLAASRQFAERREVVNSSSDMNRLYVVESAYSITGGMADHRLPMKSSQIWAFARALAESLKRRGLPLGDFGTQGDIRFDPVWLAAVTDDLFQAGERALIVAGQRQPVWVHELALVLNESLGGLGRTVTLHRSRYSSAASTRDLKTLVTDARAGNIKTMLILGGNPAYDAPADLDFATVLSRIEHTAHLSSHPDETSQRCEWHVPRAHWLESWGDVVSFDGTLGIIQPVIEPLHGGQTESEVLALLADGRDRRAYDIVRETWQPILGNLDFERKWRKVLHDGYFRGLISEARDVRRRLGCAEVLASAPVGPGPDGLEIGFYSSSVWDGRHANNAWLQELPDAVTRLSWSNAALLSPVTAEKLGVKNNVLVRIELGERRLEIPAWISPGQAEDSIALALGYGRTACGDVGSRVGYDTYGLRQSDSMGFGVGAVVTPTSGSVALANTQDHGTMVGRPIIREATLDHYRRNPTFAAEAVEHPPLRSIYPDHDYGRGYQWGMSIDLNACTGCNACVIACQSENNIQVVGEEQVRKGREMHWIRNDRYYVGDADNPRIVHQPVPCQQCENAPCEAVCPVAATSHDGEGLNVMVYNRCIGTRYCSNNCPYKVRRFNFFNYIDGMPETVRMAQNPDVTVRSRGVMEKCTFCLQRISRMKRQAKSRGRRVRDGEITTACQQACPTGAISFGNISDANSRVAQRKRNDRNYELLAELNIRPRNSYLAKLRNPNPVLENGKAAGERGDPEI